MGPALLALLACTEPERIPGPPANGGTMLVVVGEEVFAVNQESSRSFELHDDPEIVVATFSETVKALGIRTGLIESHPWGVPLPPPLEILRSPAGRPETWTPEAELPEVLRSFKVPRTLEDRCTEYELDWEAPAPVPSEHIGEAWGKLVVFNHSSEVYPAGSGGFLPKLTLPASTDPEQFISNTCQTWLVHRPTSGSTVAVSRITLTASGEPHLDQPGFRRSNRWVRSNWLVTLDTRRCGPLWLGSEDGAIYRWDPDTVEPALLWPPRRDGAQLRALAILPDGGLLLGLDPGAPNATGVENLNAEGFVGEGTDRDVQFTTGEAYIDSITTAALGDLAFLELRVRSSPILARFSPGKWETISGVERVANWSSQMVGMQFLVGVPGGRPTLYDPIDRSLCPTAFEPLNTNSVKEFLRGNDGNFYVLTDHPQSLQLRVYRPARRPTE